MSANTYNAPSSPLGGFWAEYVNTAHQNCSEYCVNVVNMFNSEYVQKNINPAATLTLTQEHSHTQTQAPAQAKAPYLITSHQSQVSEGFAALSNLGGSTICDLFAPSNIHRLYCHAVPPNGYQSWKDIKGMKYTALQMATSAPRTHWIMLLLCTL